VLALVAPAACSGGSETNAGAAPSSSDGGAAIAAPAAANAAAGTTTDAGSSATSTHDAAAPPAIGCAGKTGARGDRIVHVASQGDRTARLHVPSTLDGSKPAMLVLNFHGILSNALQEELLTNMSASSDAHGYIVAYPEGFGQSWNAGVCCGTALADSIDDVAFTRALLASLEADYCIDPKRVFATGMSNGGHFSYRLACEMSDVFGAVAPVGGVLLDHPCAPSRPIPILHFHGTADPIIAYGGGGPNTGFPSVEQSVGAFEASYGCAGEARVTVSSNGDATCARAPGCSADVELCTIDGGGHTWPGGIPLPFGKTSTDINATDTMIDFFEKHPLP
jgi:polyhydroxybutyrate depolymerase